MKVQLENVPKVIAISRIVLLALAFFCLFVLDLSLLALILVSIPLLFRIAMRSKRFNIRVIEILTGVPVHIGKPTSEVAQNQPSLHTENPSATRAPNYFRDPIAMSPDKIGALIDQSAEPALRLKRHWPPQVAFLGNSWLGGAPALPDGLAWPTHPDTGLSLHHLAQIDLSEMPSLATGAKLPKEGMLWFFADISIDLEWSEGPPAKGTAVVFHPTSTKGMQLAAVPETLPEVDHPDDQMTGQLWNFKGPNFALYPRWPITAHETLAWPFQDNQPDGVTDPMAYSEALQAREKDEKAKICGQAVPEDYRAKLITKEIPEERTRPNGTTFTYNKPIYAPELWGAKFPFTARFAHHTLRWMNHDFATALQDASGRISYAKKTKNAPQERDLKVLETNAPVLEKLDALMRDLKQAEQDTPLSAALNERTQALFITFFDKASRGSKADGYAQNGAIDFAAEAMSTPALFDTVPSALLEQVAPTLQPWHHYTEHFLLGPKSSATNPTAGKGIRLAQFDSDYALRFMFCDVGIIDFWIDEDDLAAGRWDKAYGATAGG